MKYLEILRANLAALDLSRTAAIAEMEAVTTLAGEESRSALTPEETVLFEAARSKVSGFDAEAVEIEARIKELEAVEARTAEIAKRPELQVIRREDPIEVMVDRNATPRQLADALTRSLEDRVEDPDNMAAVHTLVRKHAPRDREWARGLIVRATDDYTSAFSKMINGQAHLLTPEEQRAAMAVGTTTTGGVMVPTFLDPTIILTNAGTDDSIRALATKKTLTSGNAWHGITSAGVTASWDGELVEVSDDSPTLGTATITPIVAQAFVQASLIATQDISGLESDILNLLGDARQRLEATAFATGAGSTTAPRGIFTAINATTGQQTVSTTAATIGLVDIHALYKALAIRWRKRGTWLANPTYTLAVKALGTALSASYSTDITQGTAGSLLGRPVVESDDAPVVQTTTAKDNEIIFGDFSNFYIVDMPGSATMQYVPTLFNTSNNLPDGRQGWFLQWRVGSDSVNDKAFVMLVDKTSA